MRPIHRVLIGLGLWATLASAATADSVTVGVASNFLGPFRAIAARFESETPHSVRVVSGSSGRLFAQVRQGAPLDLLLSADQDKPAALHAAGFGEAPFTYAIGTLALWIPGERGVSPARLSELRNQRIALANPRHAPYGMAAANALNRVGIADKNTLIFGENVNQAFQFAATGNVDAALVSLAQLRAANVPPVEYTRIPTEWHAPIIQDAIVISDRGAVEALARFLGSAGARQVLDDFGYKAPATAP